MVECAEVGADEVESTPIGDLADPGLIMAQEFGKTVRLCFVVFIESIMFSSARGRRRV